MCDGFHSVSRLPSVELLSLPSCIKYYVSIILLKMPSGHFHLAATGSSQRSAMKWSQFIKRCLCKCVVSVGRCGVSPFNLCAKWLANGRTTNITDEHDEKLHIYLPSDCHHYYHRHHARCRARNNDRNYLFNFIGRRVWRISFRELPTFTSLRTAERYE